MEEQKTAIAEQKWILRVCESVPTCIYIYAEFLVMAFSSSTCAVLMESHRFAIRSITINIQLDVRCLLFIPIQHHNK